jgi:hypothetical protein
MNMLWQEKPPHAGNGIPIQSWIKWLNKHKQIIWGGSFSACAETLIITVILDFHSPLFWG